MTLKTIAASTVISVVAFFCISAIGIVGVPAILLQPIEADSNIVATTTTPTHADESLDISQKLKPPNDRLRGKLPNNRINAESEKENAAEGSAHGGGNFFAGITSTILIQLLGPMWWIYLTQYACLFTLVFLLFSYAHKSHPQDVLTHGLAEWAINSPPTLGVIGTLVSLSGFMTHSSESAQIVVFFKAAFMNAASTTVIGGLIYVVGLLAYAFVRRKWA